MDIQYSKHIAAVLGPFMMIVTATEMINWRIWADIPPAHVFLNGTIWLLGGLALVRFHNIWASDWRVLVTIAGWLTLLAGLFRMIFPEAPQASGGVGTYMMVGVIFGIGAVLAWQGWRRA